jgi:hypothetical protein
MAPEQSPSFTFSSAENHPIEWLQLVGPTRRDVSKLNVELDGQLFDVIGLM